MTTITDNTIIHGECLQVLPQLPVESVKFVLTDPPYIANHRSRDGRKVPRIGRSSALFRGAGAAMGCSGPWVEALSGVFVLDGDRPSAFDPGRKRMPAARVVDVGVGR
jgi:hypothetical protein